MGAPWIHKLMPWLEHRQETQNLAKEIEQRVRQLIPDCHTPASGHDTLTLLRSANALLAQLPIVSPELPKATDLVPEPSQTPAEEAIDARHRELSTAIETGSEPPAPPVSLPFAPARVSDEDVAPSELGKELIKLRDWVQTAASSDGTSPERVLNGLDRKILRTLAREGFTPLEETGPFQRDRQEILETTPTEDPSLNDHISATVRSGYMFQNTLFRPQQVILYTCDKK